MPPRPPTVKQQQHRAFMAKAMATAPAHLKPQEKMRWAAQGWNRQKKGSGVGGVNHPGFHGVAKAIAKREQIPIQEASAELASSSRKASSQAKAVNPRLKKVRGGRIPAPQRPPRVERPRNVRQAAIAQATELIAESNALEAQLQPDAPPLLTRERNRIVLRIHELHEQVRDIYEAFQRQQTGGIIKPPTNETGLVGQPAENPLYADEERFANEAQEEYDFLTKRIRLLESRDPVQHEKEINDLQRRRHQLALMMGNSEEMMMNVEQTSHARNTEGRRRGGAIRGKGIVSSLLKAAPYVFKAVKIGSQIASKAIGSRNKNATDVLDVIGGLGVTDRRRRATTVDQRKARASKLASMRRKQKIR